MPALSESEREELDKATRVVAQAAIDKKATDLVVIEIFGRADYCDRVVVCSGSSERQVRAIAQSVMAAARSELGQVPLGAEGLNGGAWVLVDLGDVIVHAFHGAARDFYDLEGLWADAPRVALDELGLEAPPPEPEADVDDDFLFDGFMAPVA